MDSPWSGFFEGKDPLKVAPTGVKEETLTHIGNRFSSPPPNAAEFIIHKGLLRILAARKDMVDNKIVDWAMGEAMAFGSLLKEGEQPQSPTPCKIVPIFVLRYHFINILFALQEFTYVYLVKMLNVAHFLIVIMCYIINWLTRQLIDHCATCIQIKHRTA